MSVFKVGDVITVRKQHMTVIGIVPAIDSDVTYYICGYMRGRVPVYKMVYIDDENPAVPLECKNLHFCKMNTDSLYKSVLMMYTNREDDILNVIPKCISENELAKLSISLIKHPCNRFRT